MTTLYYGTAGIDEARLVFDAAQGDEVTRRLKEYIEQGMVIELRQASRPTPFLFNFGQVVWARVEPVDDFWPGITG